jgi:LysM repeat protein
LGAGTGPPARQAKQAAKEGRQIPVRRIHTLLAAALVAAALATAAIAAPPARGAVPHTVQPGETLWSIAAASNFTTRTIATYNGLSEDAEVYPGETIEIPAEAEGAEALADAGPVGSSSSGSASASRIDAAPQSASAPSWTAPVYCPPCPAGQAYLASNAAAAWKAMRQESLGLYGVDLYPTGPLSGYRSHAQQRYLYHLYLSGRGALAFAPGSSAHEYGTAVDLAAPAMAEVIDRIGAGYGWAKTEAPSEWWHVNYVGP